MPHPAPRVVVINGTSSGIGLATAVANARAGWTTVADLRDPDLADMLRAAASEAGVEIDVRRLDVTDAGARSTCLSQVVSQFGGIHSVGNNAGAASVGRVETLDLEAFRPCLEVNFFGVVYVSRAALLYLRASNGRLRTVSSAAASWVNCSTRPTARPSSPWKGSCRRSPRSLPPSEWSSWVLWRAGS